MFDIIGKDINSINLYLLEASLINKKWKEKKRNFSLDLRCCFFQELL